MKRLFTLLAFTLIWLLILTNCASEQKKQAEITDEKTDAIVNDTKSVKTTKKSEQIIFYDMPSPIEMAAMLNRMNSPFYDNILTPINDIDRYQTASSQALTLGVFGVDLGYIKLHDQTQEAIKYLAIVKKLTRKIGIPLEETKQAFEMLEKGMNDKDIVLNVMSKTYSMADTYLRQNDRNSSAALILLGGWIEAQHIALNIYEQEGNKGDILNRIAEQKYSLNTIMELLSNNQYDTVVMDYFEQLRKLQKIYSEIEINFEDSDVAIDTIQKVITLNNKSRVSISKDQLSSIATIIRELRTSIIDFS